MIRKKITYKLTQNLIENNQFWGILIQLPNKPLLYPRAINTNDVIGDTIEDTIINIRTDYLSKISSLSLEEILITSGSNYITFDYPAIGAWGGYGDSDIHDSQYLVWDNSPNIPRYIYSQVINNTIEVTTSEYDTETGLTPNELSVRGLEGNNYYMDNDIFISVGAETEGITVYIDLSITDMQTQKVVNSRMYYFNNNTLTFDLAIMIKALMSKPQSGFNYSELLPYPINTNYGKYKIEIIRYYKPLNSTVIVAGSAILIEKTFIRGGVIDHVSNITAIENVPLRNCEKLPVWQGYPTAEYRLINGDIIQINDLTNVAKEFRPQPDCNAYYFKFKNKKGGYSYWMFNKSKADISANNVGYSDVYGEINDFGSLITVSNEVSGKIPYAFKGLVYDLITSSETYLYEGNNKWTRVIQKSNKVTDNTNKRVFDVTFKFDKIINYNPTI